MNINKLRYWYHDFKKSFITIRGVGNKIIKTPGTILFVKWDIEGNNNVIKFGDCYLKNVTIKIRGNGHRIQIANSVSIYGGILWIEGTNNTIKIDENTSVQSAHLASTETDNQIIIGKNCMLAEEVIIRNGDSHPIYELETGKQLNLGKNVIIKDNVWVGTRSQILKGITIENNSVVGAGSIVVKSVEKNCIVAGNPAQVIKKGTYWEA
jgi:acetyltransferase-like isoleucine patch superfamily enzyme